MARCASEYSKHSPFAGITSSKGLLHRKIPQKVKLQAVKLKPCGRNAARETKDKQNMKICKPVIDKHENICVGVYLHDVGVLASKLSG
jgi:hypothetical protein